MKKAIFLLFLVLSIAAILVRYSNKATEIILGIKPKSGISVMSNPQSAKVYIDGKEVGTTPYENKDLGPKEYFVKIEKESLFWQGKVRLILGTQTIINRDLAKDGVSQAGEVLTLEQGKGMTVISNPSGAEVEVDGKILGRTPLTFVQDVGEHTISLSYPNYLKRSIRANLPDGFNLTVAVDLALSEADLTKVTTPPITETSKVLVLDTPTGFLRVREKPSLAAKEIVRVKPGDELILLEEGSSWARVRLSDGTEGYVSTAYVEKKK